ncbi:zinc-dependent alcohol dehydrogenase family protein [Acidisoma cellulosilytica]|uniref:Zinc-dependent alcohol dehydrogenase family protein n=1 Tax=Acidisoma cellulosilyticum TaxID=2802395 RepID=A0A963Z739_9PROT|nr:zinc-dependent alcohol dehydrogenase family protein [Acidisoma cellulosilyticum]MCB8884089.1 zinc-dependent alcohol dehydrogenase family protein [Acidisoma cellulosilyticum]
MSRVVRFHRLGGPEVLQFDELDIGNPGPGEVRIRVRALGLNRAECMFRRGVYPEVALLPAKIGYEASGEIEAVGSGVVDLSVGDKVSTIPAFSLNQYGVYGEAAIVPSFAVVKHPSSLSFPEAASIWMQYLTAYGAVVEYGRLKAGETVLVTAASSSVGLAAIQVANSLGATAIAATRSAAKRDALLAAGASRVVVTDEQDLATEVMRLTDGNGANLAVDPIGGPAMDAIINALGENSVLVPYGIMITEPTIYPLVTALAKNLTIHAFTLPFLTRDPNRMKQGKEFVLSGVEAGQLKPIISRIFPFEEMVDAHRFMESNQQVGKIVVTI